MSVLARGSVRALPLLPRGAVRRIASPYIAGELRRLRENPRIATYVASDTVKRVAASGGRR